MATEFTVSQGADLTDPNNRFLPFLNPSLLILAASPPRRNTIQILVQVDLTSRDGFRRFDV